MDNEPPKRRLRRQKIDTIATLNAYEQRIRSLPQSELYELEGAWLSSYDNWDTVEADKMSEEVEGPAGDPFLDNHTVRLLKVALERGVNALGITSERRAIRRYLAEIPVEGGRAASKVVFVGGHNSFTQKSSSKWSISRRDKRYKK